MKCIQNNPRKRWGDVVLLLNHLSFCTGAALNTQNVGQAFPHFVSFRYVSFFLYKWAILTSSTKSISVSTSGIMTLTQIFCFLNLCIAGEFSRGMFASSALSKYNNSVVMSTDLLHYNYLSAGGRTCHLEVPVILQVLTFFWVRPSFFSWGEICQKSAKTTRLFAYLEIVDREAKTPWYKSTAISKPALTRYQPPT